MSLFLMSDGFYGHTSSFRHEEKRNSTALAGYVWEKDLGPEPEIEWSILSHARAYRVGNRTCDLCLTEKVEIAKNFSDPQYLNKRGELSQKCRHNPSNTNVRILFAQTNA